MRVLSRFVGCGVANTECPTVFSIRTVDDDIVLVVCIDRGAGIVWFTNRFHTSSTQQSILRRFYGFVDAVCGNGVLLGF